MIANNASNADHCGFFERFESGQIDEETFSSHRQSCSICQNLSAQDQQLLDQVQSLKRPVDAPGLWNRIESDLVQESRKKKRSRILPFSPKTMAVLRVAAVLIVAVGLGLRFWPRQDQSKLLAPKALARVERLEKSYAEAIEELEKSVTPKLTSMDIELALLYRDRLETIDAQIARCQDALNINPGNVHIRQYMMAALQDKKDTLIEIQKS